MTIGDRGGPRDPIAPWFDRCNELADALNSSLAREAAGALRENVLREALGKAEGILRAVRDNGGALKAITMQYPPRGGNFETVLGLVNRYFAEHDDSLCAEPPAIPSDDPAIQRERRLREALYHIQEEAKAALGEKP